MEATDGGAGSARSPNVVSEARSRRCERRGGGPPFYVLWRSVRWASVGGGGRRSLAQVSRFAISTCNDFEPEKQKTFGSAPSW